MHQNMHPYCNDAHTQLSTSHPEDHLRGRNLAPCGLPLEDDPFHDEGTYWLDFYMGTHFSLAVHTSLLEDHDIRNILIRWEVSCMEFHLLLVARMCELEDLDSGAIYRSHYPKHGDLSSHTGRHLS